MPVNPYNPSKILVVHGVQTGTDADQRQDRLIRDLIANRLGNLELEFEVELYRYENINDRAIAPYRRLLKLTVGTPAGTVLAGEALDLIGDVVINVADGGPPHEIHRELHARILAEYADGNPLCVVAHSLGSIYAFDVVNELMHEPGCCLRPDRTTWPVQSLMTLGSPIGLSMFRKARPAVTALTAPGGYFRWRNYWDRNDPVVSGSSYGRPLVGYVRDESHVMYGNDPGWLIRDRIADMGRQ